VLTGQISPVVNPATGKVFGPMPVLERSRVAQAVEDTTRLSPVSD